MKAKMLIVSCVLILTIRTGLAQKDVVPPLQLVISLPVSKIQGTKDLELNVVLKNKSNSSVQVYKYLMEGYIFDPDRNFHLVIEKKTGKQFQEYKRGSLYSKVPIIDSTEKMEIERVVLPPKDSIVYHYHVDDIYAFKKGDYRIKCIFRNNIASKEKVVSDWIYFTVPADMYITRYFDQ